MSWFVTVAVLGFDLERGRRLAHDHPPPPSLPPNPPSPPSPPPTTPPLPSSPAGWPDTCSSGDWVVGKATFYGDGGAGGADNVRGITGGWGKAGRPLVAACREPRLPNMFRHPVDILYSHGYSCIGCWVMFDFVVLILILCASLEWQIPAKSVH